MVLVSSVPRDDDAVTAAEPDGEAMHAVEQADEQADEQASAEMMALLSEHVPLALLADLAEPAGPSSPAILEDEGLPEVAWWE